MSLKRKTPLKRTGRLNPIGKKGRRDRLEMAAAEKFMGPPICALGHMERDNPIFPPVHQCQDDFTGRWLVRHHIWPRDLGGGNEPENLMWLCNAAHHWVHEVDWKRARELGLLK